jgi:hypothetical protein
MSSNDEQNFDLETLSDCEKLTPEQLTILKWLKEKFYLTPEEVKSFILEKTKVTSEHHCKRPYKAE